MALTDFTLTLTDFTLHFSLTFTKLLYYKFIPLLNNFTMQEKSFRNALHRYHGLFFLHHIKTQVVKERLIGFSERAHLLVLYVALSY